MSGDTFRLLELIDLGMVTVLVRRSQMSQMWCVVCFIFRDGLDEDEVSA